MTMKELPAAAGARNPIAAAWNAVDTALADAQDVDLTWVDPPLAENDYRMAADTLGFVSALVRSCRPSHVLAAMGVTPALSECAMRVSFGWNSTIDEVEAYLKGFGEVVGRHRARHGVAA